MFSQIEQIFSHIIRTRFAAFLHAHAGSANRGKGSGGDD